MISNNIEKINKLITKINLCSSPNMFQVAQEARDPIYRMHTVTSPPGQTANENSIFIKYGLENNNIGLNKQKSGKFTFFRSWLTICWSCGGPVFWGRYMVGPKGVPSGSVRRHITLCSGALTSIEAVKLELWAEEIRVLELGNWERRRV